MSFLNPTHRPLDLKRHLILRVCLFALAVLLLGTAVALVEMRYRVRDEIQRSGQTIRQLIVDEVQRNHDAFNRTLSADSLDLAVLAPVGELLHFCVQLTDLYSRDIGSHCFNRQLNLPPWLDTLMRLVIGPEAQYQGTIGQYPGITVGRLTVTPNLGSELFALGYHLLNLLAVSLTILLFSYLIYRPVRNALAPSKAMLETLKRMENGDLGARMPTLALIELDRIGQGFNHLAERLQQTIGSQQKLAHRLLTAREEERLHLSRELHDEFGQYLTSLNAEASYAMELADDSLPALRPCAEAIGRTVNHLMEVLQQILHRLRPTGLDQFGLESSLRQLAEHWNQRHHHVHFRLHTDGSLDQLDDNLAVTIYRIVQESITNNIRHGRAAIVDIDIRRRDAQIHLNIVDDSPSTGERSSNIDMPKGAGFGLLGMEERVLALGGRLQILAREPQGILIDVVLPVSTPGGESE